jgi:hypothetical protein
MDSTLVEYLSSGKAWVLVGSGPSIQMGYPSWKDLATVAYEKANSQTGGVGIGALNSALARNDFPKVFEEAKRLLGMPSLLQSLREKLTASHNGEIYNIIAKWPVPVYLTTNYDDEIQNHLAALRESYIPYGNSEDHLSYLVPDFNGAIIKLHGDLRSEEGLILTYSQYRDISSADKWQYWRTKMTSVFQMNRLVVVGHSLTDPNIRHILQLAKQGAGVVQPICWIAPDVPVDKIKEFLENFRIRVISYDNSDGKHYHLLRLLQTISDFVPSRTSVQLKTSIAKVIESPMRDDAAAPGLFVFNKLIEHQDYSRKRIETIVCVLKSSLATLDPKDPFKIMEVLYKAGWPTEVQLTVEVLAQVQDLALKEGLIENVGDKFMVGTNLEASSLENKKQFHHMRERFKTSLQLRLRRNFRSLTADEVERISSDIHESLIGYFKFGGLTLATTLFSATAAPAVSASIIKFINDASCRYSDYSKRLAFFKTSVDVFAHAEDAERDYLGRISQGFFAFHAMGVFGDVAIERLEHANRTVWVVDSSVQIPLLAVASASNAAFVSSFSRLCDMGIRFFTTESLFEESREHLWFADMVVNKYGADSQEIISAARGEPPFRKGNLFLEGFIKWQAAGNPCDWNSYVFAICGQHKFTNDSIKEKLKKYGIEVVDLQIWPGFKSVDFSERDEYIEKVKQTRERYSRTSEGDISYDELHNPIKKAIPEGEVFLIVKKERLGKYYMLSEEKKPSPSWFISQTAILNTIESGSKITWQPDAFLDFASTLSPPPPAEAGERAFEALLWSVARDGVNFVTEIDIRNVFKGVIDQAVVKLEEQQQLYEHTIEQKYGESLSSVLSRIAPSQKILATMQLSNEIAHSEQEKREKAEERAVAEAKRADLAEKKLAKVGHFIKRMESKRKKAKKHKRKKKK